MIGVDLSTSANVAVNWIILKCFCVVNVILNSIWIMLVFYCKFSVFKIVLFYLKINKPNMHNNIIDISSFQNGLNVLFSSTGFYLKSKVLEGSHKGKNMFFCFWTLLHKIYIFVVVIFFFLHSCYPINSIFQWQYMFIRFMFWMKHFSS